MTPTNNASGNSGGMIRSEDLSRPKFLAYAEGNDFDGEIPLIIKPYLALYLDMEKGNFSSEAFHANYKEANGVHN